MILLNITLCCKEVEEPAGKKKKREDEKKKKEKTLREMTPLFGRQTGEELRANM